MFIEQIFNFLIIAIAGIAEAWGVTRTFPGNQDVAVK